MSVSISASEFAHYTFCIPNKLSLKPENVCRKTCLAQVITRQNSDWKHPRSPVFPAGINFLFIKTAVRHIMEMWIRSCYIWISLNPNLPRKEQTSRVNTPGVNMNVIVGSWTKFPSEQHVSSIFKLFLRVVGFCFFLMAWVVLNYFPLHYTNLNSASFVTVFKSL